MFLRPLKPIAPYAVLAVNQVSLDLKHRHSSLWYLYHIIEAEMYVWNPGDDSGDLQIQWILGIFA